VLEDTTNEHNTFRDRSYKLNKDKTALAKKIEEQQKEIDALKSSVRAATERASQRTGLESHVLPVHRAVASTPRSTSRGDKKPALAPLSASARSHHNQMAALGKAKQPAVQPVAPGASGMHRKRKLDESKASPSLVSNGMGGFLKPNKFAGFPPRKL
ncbi:hypothetical protein HDU91_002414, partial [Kappamyces sp. JEL0680]